VIETVVVVVVLKHFQRHDMVCAILYCDRDFFAKLWLVIFCTEHLCLIIVCNVCLVVYFSVFFLNHQLDLDWLVMLAVHCHVILVLFNCEILCGFLAIDMTATDRVCDMVRRQYR